MSIFDDPFSLDDPESIKIAMRNTLIHCCFWMVLALVLVVAGALLLVLHPWTAHAIYIHLHTCTESCWQALGRKRMLNR